MTGLQDYVDQVLDDKYRLERLLGQGGMGAVYLATHLGTGRYVALKLITPQFMGNEEFVERFKREAKAAGRLRHPNVVDVTDFGFAQAGGGTVAYLVMEYLDGCTLGDVLSEEQKLPLEWVVDILEQVCSAVHEAHQQGIVHRDLKPENIWLEPNRLGGYRVKVLDFGIAKLGEANTPVSEVPGVSASTSARSSLAEPGPTTQAAPSAAATQRVRSSEGATAMLSGAAATNIGNAGNATTLKTDGAETETATLLHSKAEEAETQMLNLPAQTNEAETAIPLSVPTQPEPGAQSDSPAVAEVDDDRTLMLDQATRPGGKGSPTTWPSPKGRATELTRVGAIMGTPLYMSPEQCGGKHLDARSDLYSLGVIAYQMLAGEPPFTGDTNQVMRGHIESAPPALRERRKVPKRVANLVMTALAKDPADRPQTAIGFANSLRAQADGIGSLYRRAFALYSEYFPKFLKMSLIAHLPVFVTMASLIALQIAIAAQPKGLGVMKVVIICGLIISGLLQLIAYFVAASAISGMTAIIVTQLSAAPLRPVELRTAFTVLKQRWKPFLKTSIRITLRIFIGFVLLIIPGIIVSIRYGLYAPVVLVEGLEKKAAMRRARELASRSWRTIIIVWLLQFLIPIAVSFFIGQITFNADGHAGPMRTRTREVFQQLSGLINIVVVPLVSIVSALLYLKMRQLGGETLSAALAQIEEVDTKHSQWQQRMRSRVSLPTPRSR